MGSILSAPDQQKKIYLEGFAGKRSPVRIDFNALEEQAKKTMSPQAFAYVAGGAGLEDTIDNNREAFGRVKIVPRMLRDVAERDTGVELLGKRIPVPILLSPVGVLELAHSQADLAVAKAAASLGVPFIFSNQASVPMEECSAAMAETPRWFQLYWSKSNDLVASFVQRAEKCGCSAIVVTLDTTLLGWRTQDLDLGYLPFLEGRGIAQYTSDPVFQRLMDEPDEEPAPKREISYQSLAGLVRMVNNYPGKGFFSKLKSGRPIKAVRKFVSIYSNPGITWDNLSFLRQHAQLPILLKGILHPDDASKAIDNGVNGIIVSNHGGRQVDGAISTFEALPGIVNAVSGRVPVLMDGGIRGGADVFKALALGATAVCIGRPYVYGLAIGGEEGVRSVVQHLASDFELTMALSGCRRVSEINKGCVFT